MGTWVTDASDRSPLFILPALAIGMVGLIHDSWPMPVMPWINLHLLFGAILWLCVAARFCRRVQQIRDMQPAQISLFSRSMLRHVYLLLYLLMFFNLAIGGLRTEARAESFQAYLLAGLVALATIHGLAALCRRLAVQGAGLRAARSAKRTAEVA